MNKKGKNFGPKKIGVKKTKNWCKKKQKISVKNKKKWCKNKKIGVKKQKNSIKKLV